MGTYCYVCEDLASRDTPEEDILLDRLASASLAALRGRLRAAAADLAAGRPAAWAALWEAVAEGRGRYFHGQAPRSWWLALEDQLRRAEALAGDGAPLRAAHAVRRLAPPVPLRREAARPRVFVKTFKAYTRKTVAEIRRCSAKAPDFGRDLIQAPPHTPHPTLP